MTTKHTPGPWLIGNNGKQGKKSPVMKRASYRDAIRWIVDNDDTEWLDEDHGIINITASLVADLFDVKHDRLIADLRRELAKAESQS